MIGAEMLKVHPGGKVGALLLALVMALFTIQTAFAYADGSFETETAGNPAYACSVVSNQGDFNPAGARPVLH